MKHQTSILGAYETKEEEIANGVSSARNNNDRFNIPTLIHQDLSGNSEQCDHQIPDGYDHYDH